LPKRIIVREAVPEDYLSLTELAWQLGHQAESERLKTRLVDLLNRDDHKLFVAETGGKVAGWVHAFLYRPLHKECVVEIAGLVVDEKYRKMGIGRRLLAVTEDWARTQDCTRLSLCSNVKREEAHKFYQALGYQRTKTQYTFTKELTK